MENLAIKGHETRGREVIELLEMLGGINAQECDGTNSCLWYYIDKCNKINFFTHTFNLGNYNFFTLEEFLEKFPYKVGDKVKDAIIEDYVGTIVEAKWDNYNEEVVYTVIWDNMKELSYFARDLQPYKEETMEEKVESFEILESHCSDEVKIEFDPSKKFEMVERKNGYYVVRKKLQYPKTCEECLNVLDTTMNSLDSMNGYKFGTLMHFQQLLLCRDAYWKIAGEKMWLGKPWELSIGSPVYYIYYNRTLNHIKKDYADDIHGNIVLAFPTEEMRNAFYENFKDLIEECKEVL